MKKLVAAVCIAACVAVAVYVSMAPPGTSRPEGVHPKLDGLLAQCDAEGSSFVFAFDKLAARLPELVGSDRTSALAVTRGQVANLVAGRLATCEQALAIAQHDRQGLAVVRLGAFTRRLEVVAAALKHLEGALAGSGDPRSSLDDLEAAVHAASRP